VPEPRQTAVRVAFARAAEQLRAAHLYDIYMRCDPAARLDNPVRPVRAPAAFASAMLKATETLSGRAQYTVPLVLAFDHAAANRIDLERSYDAQGRVRRGDAGVEGGVAGWSEVEATTSRTAVATPFIYHYRYSI
jgi:hypothetical protein